MELPFEKTVCRFWQQKQFTPLMREETQELRLPDSLPDVGRVIAAWGQTVIRGKEWRSDHVGVHGGVMVWVLYAPEDGSEIRRIESWLPFSVRIDQNHRGEDGVIRAESVLSSVDARSISSRKLMLRCQVGLLIQCLVPKQAELMEPKELPGDIELLQQTYPMVLTRETGEKTFLADEVVPLPSGTPTLERIIYYHISPRITEQKVMASKAVFRGAGDLHLLLQDRDGKLCGVDVEVPIAQYLDLDGSYDDGAEISNLLCSTSLEVEPTEAGELRIRWGVVSQYIVNAPTAIRCLEDAYSPRRELELTRQEVLLPGWLEEQLREEELSEVLEDIPVDAIFFPDLPMVTRQPGGAEITLGGAFQTLTAGPDGVLQSKTLKANRALDLATECDTIPSTWLRGSPTVRREGSGWRLEVKMLLKLASICTKPITMVCGIKAKPMTDGAQDRPSVIIRAKRGEETLWDIAKYCGSTVSAIQRLNRLESEPEENRLLLIPVV